MVTQGQGHTKEFFLSVVQSVLNQVRNVTNLCWVFIMKSLAFRSPHKLYQMCSHFHFLMNLSVSNHKSDDIMTVKTHVIGKLFVWQYTNKVLATKLCDVTHALYILLVNLNCCRVVNIERVVIKSFHNFFNNCRLQADLLIKGMEFSGVTESMADEDTVIVLLHQSNFWLNILRVTGETSQLVEHHALHATVKRKINSFIMSVLNRYISVKTSRRLLEPLQRNVDTLTQMCMCVSPMVEKDTFTKNLQLWRNTTDEAAIFCKSLVTILPELEHIGRDIPDLHVASDMFRNKKSEWSDGSEVYVRTLIDYSFWDYFRVIFRNCVDGASILTSEVFWKICQNIVLEISDQELYGSVQSLDPIEDIHILFGEEKSVPSVTLKIIHILTTQGLSEYKSAWNAVFDCKDKSTTIGSIKYIIDVNDFTTEADIAEKVCDKKIPRWVYDALKLKRECHQYTSKCKVIKEVLESLNYDINQDKPFWETMESLSSLEERDDEDLSLKQLHYSSDMVKTLDELVDNTMLGIFKELRKAGSLVAFIREKANDDFRHLIDAVEEHSEQAVQESTVSHLIEVKRFISPVIREKSPKSVKELFRLLQKQVYDLNITNLDQKLSECNTNLHGLKSLFRNRGEKTKDIVKWALKKGSKMSFKLADKKCHVQLKFREDKESKSYNKSDLNDLRSRVLLLKNTDAKEQNEAQANLQQRYEKFLDYVNDAMTVANVLDRLSETGHPEYIKVSLILELPDQKCEYDKLNANLTTWQEDVSENRHRYYWLNFFYPEQLRTLIHFMSHNGEEEIIQGLFSFMGLGLIDISNARLVYKRLEREIGTGSFSLPVLGAVLDELLEDMEPSMTCFPDSDESNAQCVHISDTVQKGKYFIVQINKKSESVIPTLYALYRNTVCHLPMPHQVLFCGQNTTWEDIDLLLKRCFGANDKCSTDQLFAIISVENLCGEIQFQLVEELERHLHSQVLLALVYKGSSHSFLGHFGENVHSIEPVSTFDIEKYFHHLCPNVITVTSELPGQGKSEYVQRRAHLHKLDVCTLHLSGDISAKEFVKRLDDLDLMSGHLLHIDIGMLLYPEHVDTILFQLILFRMVASGPYLSTLKADFISIEVANTINDVLRNSLFSIMLFKREELTWKNYSDFRVSQEICSPVQVVCNYLRVFRKGLLDTKDLYFVGSQTCDMLSQEKCRKLLKKYFLAGSKMSFTIANIFLSVLSDQLKKFSCSFFFRTNNIASMLGASDIIDVKSEMFKALLEMSRGFATRSIDACREDQKHSVENMYQRIEHLSSALPTSAVAMVERVQGMIQWEQSNHLIVIFHSQNFQTISALYRSKRDVPKHVEDLFIKQINTALLDYSTMNQEQLQEVLTKVARFSSGLVNEREIKKMSERYALTPDNLLKMVLIVLRVRSHVPVVIMGETGCGKTSLITYLAVICGIELNVLNIHAGTEENAIAKCVIELNDKAKTCKKSVWLFLDEINTCNHLGFIADLLCHHRCYGKLLTPYLVIMAACNPYKLRTEKSIHTAGLDSKVKVDDQSKLVYRVHPLPENLIDYVWDYGSLSDSDEKAYILRMVDGILKPHIKSSDDLKLEAKYRPCLIQLLVYSQNFIRKLEDVVSCVSLRDVNRCIHLCGWFLEMLIKKHKLKYGDRYYDSNDIQVRAIILALAHTYHSRLPNSQHRQHYRQGIADELVNQKIFQFWNEANLSDEVIRKEQDEMLDRMSLPPGIAKNTALQENVFVLLVCILNRIPVFVVGKPGCSKSLSLQLIRSNLRGKDSDDLYFKTLPQLYCVSFQGSESSTSDGIVKVFEKAKRYRELNKEDDVLPVVILDEIGLAETSRFNPLKVLHSLLEPGNIAFPDVAVVGISNWSLDAAKMNRAVHLSRPDMDVEELEYTGIAISRDILKFPESPIRGNPPKIDGNLIKAIAQAYYEYIVKKQRFANFHGLRDFYSLVKFVSKQIAKTSSMDPEDKIKIMIEGLLRNFGGLSSETTKILDVFINKTVNDPLPTTSRPEKFFHVLDLIKDNITDSMSRHLLLSTQGETALSIVENLLNKMGREYVLILGSHFDEDLTDEYDYRILSKIILCMEHGFVLILKDLDSIYGSLYDMLNQNYTEVGLSKRCRIALGPYSNPLCQVHEHFRCIVLVEEKDIDMSDPPFLNRFEKQCIKMADIISDRENKITNILDEWLGDISNIDGLDFLTSDLIPVYSQDMVSSLVHSIVDSSSSCEKDDHIISECKKVFLRACFPDGILRIDHSRLAKWNPYEVRWIREYYFGLPLHGGLGAFMKYLSDEESTGIMVFTHSNIHTSLESNLQDISKKCQFEKLGTFKSEKKFSQRVNHFWQNSPKKEWLVIQCTPSMKNLLLVKSILEKESSAYGNSEGNVRKQTIIVMHIEREKPGELRGFVNFLNGWKITVIDDLEGKCSLTNLLDKPKQQLVKERMPFSSFIEQHLFWAFSLIQYSWSHQLDKIKVMIESIKKSRTLVSFLETKIMAYLDKRVDVNQTENWQLRVACDKWKLYKYSTLQQALVEEINMCIRQPLAAVIFQIEAESAWETVLHESVGERKLETWIKLAESDSIIDISQIPLPEGPTCYQITDRAHILQCPFSRCFINRLQSLKVLFLQSVKTKYPGSDISEITEDNRCSLIDEFQSKITDTVIELVQYPYGDLETEDYFNDFCNIFSCHLGLKVSNKDRIYITKCLFEEYLDSDKQSLERSVTCLQICGWLYQHQIEAKIYLLDAYLQIPSTSIEFIKNKSRKLSCTEGRVADITKDVHENQDPMFEDSCITLVDTICDSLLPRASLVNSPASLQSWINYVSSIVLLASEVSTESKNYQALRVCRDFVLLVSVPGDLPEESLNSLAEALTVETLETEKCFVALKRLINSLKAFDHVSLECVQHFFSCYVSSCLAANPDTPVLQLTFENYNSMSLFQSSFRFLGPTLLQVLKTELGTTSLPEIDNIVTESDVLKSLDYCLKSFEASTPPNMHLACLVLDILHNNFLQDYSFNFDSCHLENLLNCDTVFKSGKSPIHALFALAFMKKSLASLFEGDRNIPQDAAQKLSGIFRLEKGDHTSPVSIKTKCLHLLYIRLIKLKCGLMYMDILQEKCQFLNVTEEKVSSYNLELHPMEMTFVDLYQRVASAYKTLPKEKQLMRQLFEESQRNGDIAYALFAFGLQEIYVPGGLHQLADTDKRDKAKTYHVLAKDTLSLNQKKLFACLCTQDTFELQLLQISSSTDATKQHMRMCILHLACLLLAYSPNDGTLNEMTSVWLMCIQKPDYMKEYFIPGNGFEKKKLHRCLHAGLHGIIDSCSVGHCSCGSVTVMHSGKSLTVCPTCKEPVQNKGISSLVLSSFDRSNIFSGQKGYSQMDSMFMREELSTVRELSPVSFRLLQFFVHGCLTTSLALKFSDQESLSNAMGLQIECNVINMLDAQLSSHWEALKTLTNFEDSGLAKWIHLILKENMSHLHKSQTFFTTEEDLMYFEKQFDTYVKDMMSNRFNKVQDEVKAFLELHPESTEALFEPHLENVGTPRTELTEYSRMMQINIHSNVKKMKIEFSNLNSAREFPIMALVTERHLELSLLQHFMPIIQWHLCTIQYAGYTLKKEDCQSKTVEIFIEDNQTKLGNEQSELLSMFLGFKDSWNTVMEHEEDMRTFNKRLPKLKYMNMNSALGSCLVMNQDDSPIVQVLIALAQIQNNFLKDLALLCISLGSPSISFMKGSEGVVLKEVLLQDVTPKQVISLTHSCMMNLLKFSEISTHFGHSRERLYDFYQIENLLKKTCVVNKTLIQIETSLPLITFSDDVFSMIDKLLEDVQHIVGREDISDSVKTKVTQSMGRAQANVHTMLDYVRMILGLLKQTPMSSASMKQKLDEFQSTWKSHLPKALRGVSDTVSQVQLSQIISLYDFIENLAANNIVFNLDIGYKKPMPEVCVNHLQTKMKAKPMHMQEAILTALKKVAFRYIHSSNAKTSDQLFSWMVKKTLWSPGVAPPVDVFHQLQTMEHIQHTIKMVETMIQQSRQNGVVARETLSAAERQKQRKRRSAKFLE